MLGSIAPKADKVLKVAMKELGKSGSDAEKALKVLGDDKAFAKIAPALKKAMAGNQKLMKTMATSKDPKEIKKLSDQLEKTTKEQIKMSKEMGKLKADAQKTKALQDALTKMIKSQQATSQAILTELK